MKIEPQKLAELINDTGISGGKTSKYQLIYNKIKAGIIAGDLPNSCELPPTRSLAESVEVSRSTIIKVYDLLKLEGLLEATMGSGHKVVTPHLNSEELSPIEVPSHPYVSISEGALAFHRNLGLINAIDDPGIAFRPGIPPLDLFPITRWKKLSDEYWKFVRASELSYYAGAGVEVLRKTLSNYLNLMRGVKCNYDQVFILSGSLQSLFLIGNLLLDPGDEVVVENPAFPNVHSVFKSLRAKVIGASLDDQGMKVEDLAQQIGDRTKLVHLTPSCHYPLGVQMGDARKEAILSLASEKGLYLIENDYENEINYPNRDGQPLFTLDTEDRTFYLGTFNRTLHPSIRVGFVVVPRHLIQYFHAIVMHSHRFVSPTSQVVLRSFIEKNYLHEHLKNVARESEKRHAQFTDFIQTHLSHQLQVLPLAAPSLHITTLLKMEAKDTAVAAALAQKGIIAHALSKCYISEPRRQGLIFGYASVHTQHMAPLLMKMADILRKF